MDALIQLSERFTLIVVSAGVAPSVTMAFLASRHLEKSPELNNAPSRFLYAWSKIALDTSLIWGIGLASAGLIGMTLNISNDSSGLGTSITIALSVLICSGVVTALGYILEKKNVRANLHLSPFDKYFGSFVPSGFIIAMIDGTGVPFFGNFFHPYLWPLQFTLTAVLFIFGVASKKPWRYSFFEANLGATLLLMALGISAWFLNWSSFTESIDSIFLVAHVVFWGAMSHVYFYYFTLTGTGHQDANLKIKTWHFTEAFAFYAFLVYAPLGATEYLRESTDQRALQEQHENQQSEIDYLKAEIRELKTQIST